MALDMGLFHDPLDTNGVKTLPPISGAFDILGGDPMAGVLTTSQKSVAGPADRELPDLIHVVNGALRPLEHMISSLAIGPELAAPLIHDRRRLPQPDDAATPV